MKSNKGLTKVAIALSLGIVSNLSYAESKIKNVILMIGDGMGPGQMSLLEEYATKAPNSSFSITPCYWC